MTTQWSLLTACLIALPLAAPLAAGQDGTLVKGKTTPADAEDAFGAPIALSVARDGGITLVYPAAVLAAGTKDRAGRVGLHFTPDLTYDGYTKSASRRPVAIAIAAR